MHVLLGEELGLRCGAPRCMVMHGTAAWLTLSRGLQGTSRWGLPVSFVDLPRQQREAVLLAWSHSPQPKMRKVGGGRSCPRSPDTQIPDPQIPDLHLAFASLTNA